MDTLFHLVVVYFLLKTINPPLLVLGLLGAFLPDIFHIISLFNAIVRKKSKSRRMWILGRVSHSFLILPIILAPLAIIFIGARIMLFGVLIHLITDVICHWRRAKFYLYPFYRHLMVWNQFNWKGVRTSGIITYPWTYLFWGLLGILWVIQVIW